MTAAPGLVACHDCDLLHRRRILADGETSRCVRCGAMLARGKSHCIERALVLSLTALMLFLMANAFPFMTLELQGNAQRSTFLSGAWALHDAGMWELAALVLLTSFALPLAQIAALLYVLGPLHLGLPIWQAARVFRWFEGVRPWAMAEVYMLGVLVALVKLSSLATIETGVALYAFAAMIPALAAAVAALEPEVVWDRLDAAR